MNKEKSIKLLNKAIASELTAINQYLYFHFICEDRGYTPLAKEFFKISMSEMKHVEQLALRILFLKGEPELVPDGKTEKIRDIKGMLALSKKLESGAIDMYNKASGESAANGDNGTKKIFDSLVDQEENHFDQFDVESDNLAEFGANYLAQQAMEGAKDYVKGVED